MATVGYLLGTRQCAVVQAPGRQINAWYSG